MKTLALAACGALALGLVGLTTPASAGSLPSAGAALLDGPSGQARVEQVSWRRVCSRVRVWRHGRRVWVTQCRNVWVGPRVRYRCGPSWNRHWCWR